MKTITAVLTFLCLHATLLADLGGVYSNRAEGFYVESLFLSKEGKALYFIAVAAVPVKWHFDSEKQKIIIRGNLGPNAKVEEREFAYDGKSDVVISQPKASARDARLLNVSKEIPEKVQKVLDAFDWDFEKHVVGKKP